MFHAMYPFWSFIISVLLAQGIKPFLPMFKGSPFRSRLFFASGGMPSSHTAGVASLCLSVGLQESFNSPLFAVTLALGIIVAYDAANVRYYAGKNIQVTKQIVRDLKQDPEIELDDPIYEEPLKDVLGHKWPEVFVGAIIGMACALFLSIL